MNALSIPIIMMAGILIYTGFNYLFIYYRRRFTHREDLTFALTSLAMGMFDIVSFCEYNSSSIAEGAYYQRVQAAILCLIGAAFVWFVMDYLELKLKRTRNFFSVLFTFFAISIFIDRSPITFDTTQPHIKKVLLPFLNLEATFYEVASGPFIDIIGLIGGVFFLYILFISVRRYWQNGGFRAKSLSISLVIFLAGLCNDLAVVIGLYQFIYVIEYAYMGIVVLMAYSLSNTIVESSIVKEELHAERNLLHTLIEILPDRIYVKDTECRFVVVNRSLLRKLGIEKPEDVVGKTDFDFYSRELADPYNIDDQMVIQSGQPLIDREEPTVDSDGNKKWTLTSKVPLRNEKEEVIGLVGIGHDITERKLTEMKLDEMMRKLHQSNQELEQFAYIASHDLQEPLRMVTSYATLIQRKLEKNVDADSKEFFSFMTDGVKRMQILINDLLSYSRLSSQAKPFEEMNLDEVLDTALSNLKVTIEEKNARIAHDPLPEVMADRVQMERLFQNLIGNSIKYCEKTPEIHISAEKKKGEWIIGIKDNGIGIDPKYNEKIFGIFQRLHRRDEYSGTGIGLAVCKKTVERHGGNIWVESEGEGKGSTFKFTIPG